MTRGDPSDQQFTSPRGAPVTMAIRESTNDWNTTNSCLTEDEYGLRDLHLRGLAIDIGGYTGGVTIALLVDNPDLRVTVIEPVPANIEAIRHNLAANGVADRCTVLHAAAGFPGGGTQVIHHNYRGSEVAEHHAYVGNISIIQGLGPLHCPNDIEHDHTEVPVVSLNSLNTPVFLKIDCEGGEWTTLRAEKARDIPRIHGEAHPTDGHRMADLVRMLPDHDITWADPPGSTDPEYGPLGFTAVLR